VSPGNRQLPQSTHHSGLFSEVERIVGLLPPIQYSRLASSEIDYYGASNNIARALHVAGIPYTRASWLHGWVPYPLVTPELLVNQACVACCEVGEVPNLLVTKNQEVFLKEKGYPRAKAVGTPFLYTQKPSVKRISGSLLIIPEHSLKETNVNYEQAKGSPLPDSLGNLRNRFSTVIACLGGFCVQKNNYLESFERAGLPWITGAWLHDAFALQRMRNLFSQFEYVATNAIGSHIPYAGYCGCKVSYYGKGHNRQREDYLQTPIYQKYPHLIDIVDREQKLEHLQEKYPFLFVEIEQSNQIKDWSKGVLGTANKVPAHQLAELIGWKIRPKDGNSWEYVPGENPGLHENA
jgi:hypothetical protein